MKEIQYILIVNNCNQYLTKKNDKGLLVLNYIFFNYYFLIIYFRHHQLHNL
jgi:hypothetical protein